MKRKVINGTKAFKTVTLTDTHPGRCYGVCQKNIKGFITREYDRNGKYLILERSSLTKVSFFQ